MKQSLADLGFSKKDVGNLKPAYAQLVCFTDVLSWNRS